MHLWWNFLEAAFFSSPLCSSLCCALRDFFCLILAFPFTVFLCVCWPLTQPSVEWRTKCFSTTQSSVVESLRLKRGILRSVCIREQVCCVLCAGMLFVHKIWLAIKCRWQMQIQEFFFKYSFLAFSSQGPWQIDRCSHYGLINDLIFISFVFFLLLLFAPFLSISFAFYTAFF